MIAALFVALIALPPEGERAVVEGARAVLGTPYVLGARRSDGVDCQGLVFLALQSAFRCSWKSYDVMPTTSIARHVAHLRAHADAYSGVLVTRIDVKPQPRRCRAVR